MTTLRATLFLGLMATFTSLAAAAEPAEVAPVLNFKMKSLDGKAVNLADYQGKVILMVNTASECGLTPQYEGLQAMYEKYSNEGLVILGFPSNDFGRQEPGTDQEIAAFCQQNYNVSFPMFSKVVVKGEDQCDLYKYLTGKETNGKFAGPIKWNFEKFLIGRNGQVIARFEPSVTPDSKKVISAIESELKNK